MLKGRLGFDGYVIGDWNGHAQVRGCSNESCPAAINAGVDMIMVPEDWKAFIANTLQQVRSGEIEQARIDDAVRRTWTSLEVAELVGDDEPVESSTV